MAKKASIFTNYEDIQKALREIGEIDMKIEAEEAEATKLINEIKEKAQEVVSPLLDRRKALEEHIELFAEARQKEDFVQKKSMDLVFGEIGFRSSGGGIRVKSTKSTVEALLSLGENFKHLLITEHKPNKEALEGVTDDFLKKIGCSRTKKTEKFWFNVHREKVTENAQ
jgi:phage host-nuclease inhibitor protein Gam